MRKPRKRFTLVFSIDLGPIRQPGQSVDGAPSPFVLRTTAADFAAAMVKVNLAFCQPLVIAAFRGWPKMHRGEEIKSRDDVVSRYGPEAMKATENTDMMAARGN